MFNQLFSSKTEISFLGNQFSNRIIQKVSNGWLYSTVDPDNSKHLSLLNPPISFDCNDMTKTCQKHW